MRSTDKVSACLAVTAMLCACTSLPPLVPNVIQGDGPADVAADYLMTLCTLTDTQRDDILPAVNAAISPNSVVLTCAQK